MFQAVNTKKSTPKLTNIKGDNSKSVIYRNIGNHHAHPFVWAETVTLSGTEVLLASGISFHGYDLAEYANVTITPLDDYESKRIWVEKDIDANTIKIKSSAAFSTPIKIDVKYMLGEPMSVNEISCRGFGAPKQSLP